MSPDVPPDGSPPPIHPFTAEDVSLILQARGWLAPNGITPGTHQWMESAAELLGPQASGPEALADLLQSIFHYDANEILRLPESHIVLAREGARMVLRELAHLVLQGPEINSDRFKEIINALKEKLPWRGRELFHPIRLALAGRAGEGELDRIILLLDGATPLPFAAPVKGTRQRILEFCAALD